LVLPVITSTSMPRSLKIAAARGSILSEISTLGAVMAIAFKNPFVPICRSSTLSRWHEEGTALRQAQGEGEGARSGRQAGVGPVEPRAERFDIGGVDGCPAPDTQTRRGV